MSSVTAISQIIITVLQPYDAIVTIFSWFNQKFRFTSSYTYKRSDNMFFNVIHFTKFILCIYYIYIYVYVHIYTHMYTIKVPACFKKNLAIFVIYIRYDICCERRFWSDRKDMTSRVCRKSRQGNLYYNTYCRGWFLISWERSEIYLEIFAYRLNLVESAFHRWIIF